MGFTAKEFFKAIIRKGIFISWSTGRTFDPRDQKRTCPIADIVKSKTKQGEAENVELDKKYVE